MKKVIHADALAKPLGPYSQGVMCGDMLFLSGQIGMDQSGNLVGVNIETQVKEVFKNIALLCKEAGATLADVVKLTIYLIDFADFDAVNEHMQQIFQKPYPARTTIEVKALPKNAKIEIDAIITLSKA